MESLLRANIDKMMPLDLSREVVMRPTGDGPRLAPIAREAGIRILEPGEVRFVALEELPRAEPKAAVALQHGLWPGISRGPSQGAASDETASASRQPWVDANGYWIAWLGALDRNRPPVLAYLPDDKAGLKPDRLVPFDSLELALIESWVFGGNYVLALESRFRDALLKHVPKAESAWRNLVRTSRWLRDNVVLFRCPVVPIIMALVEPGDTTPEVVNLMYRHNVSPALAPAAVPPRPDPQRTLALVAVSISPPAPAARARILAHAEAGAVVVVDSPGAKAWWRDARLKPLRAEQDRDFYTLGRGQLVAYHEPISDVSEFAFDVIDFITHKRRALRMWNAPALIGLLTFSPRRGQVVLHVVNYGSPTEMETQTRVQGVFSRATLLKPDAPPRDLLVTRRGATTEIQIPGFRRLAVVVFG